MTKRRGIFTGVCLLIFIWLTYLVSTGRELAFDTVIREWFYSIRTSWLTEVVKAITFMGNTKTIIVICLVLLLLPLVRGKAGLQVTKKIGIPIAVVAIVGSAINKAIKHIVMRPRPDVSLHLIEQGGWSFPSGHSISSLLLYGFLAWLILYYVNGSREKSGLFAYCDQDGNAPFANTAIARRKLFANIAAVILTLLWVCVGLSRIYLGVHYPTDVLGGWMLGMVVMMVTMIIIEKIEIK